MYLKIRFRENSLNGGVDYEEQMLICENLNIHSADSKDSIEVSFGGNGFTGIVSRPLFYSKNGISSDLLNTFVCETDDCRHHLFNTQHDILN